MRSTWNRLKSEQSCEYRLRLVTMTPTTYTVVPFGAAAYTAGTGLYPQILYDLRQSVYQALTASSVVTGVVGSRIYPKIPPQAGNTLLAPTLILRVISNPATHNLDGAAGLRTARVEIRIMSRLQSDCAAVVEEVRQLFQGLYGYVGGTTGVGVFTITTTLDAESENYDEPDDGSDAGTHWISHEYVFRYRESLPSR